MRISDWSSDVCSSDLERHVAEEADRGHRDGEFVAQPLAQHIGVLRPDGDDEPAAEAESLYESDEKGRHGCPVWRRRAGPEWTGMQHALPAGAAWADRKSTRLNSSQ